MKYWLLLALLIGDSAAAQDLNAEAAEQLPAPELFRRMLPTIDFQPERVIIWPGSKERIRGAAFWSRPRASASAVICEADVVTINLSEAHMPPISSGRLYSPIDPTAADPTAFCADLQPGFAFFRAPSAAVAEEAIRVLRDILARAANGNMRGMTVSCANCDDPRAALAGLEREQLLEVTEDRCLPEERSLLCLEFRFLGPPHGGWRLRTDRGGFARLIHYGGLVLEPAPPPPPPPPDGETTHSD